MSIGNNIGLFSSMMISLVKQKGLNVDGLKDFSNSDARFLALREHVVSARNRGFIPLQAVLDVPDEIIFGRDSETDATNFSVFGAGYVWYIATF